MRNLIFTLLLCGTTVSLHAQAATVAETWDRLEALPSHAHLRLSTDVGSHTCYFIAADDRRLTCGRKDGSAQGRLLYPRSIIQSVKVKGLPSGGAVTAVAAAARPLPGSAAGLSSQARPSARPGLSVASAEAGDGATSQTLTLASTAVVYRRSAR